MISPQSVLYACVLFLIQALAALPWAMLLFFAPDELNKLWKDPFSRKWLRRLLAFFGFGIVGPAILVMFVQDRDTLELLGHVFGAALQISLIADAFILAFALLLLVWPKGGAVGLAAFREGVRQPL